MGAVPYGCGHINDTFRADFQQNGRIKRYIVQRINKNIFKEPEKVMENIGRVTRFLRKRIIEAGGDPERQTLNIIPAKSGRDFAVTEDGEYWRVYVFIEGASIYETAEDASLIYAANKAFGNFQEMLSRLPGGRLHETIPDFHNTKKRFRNFVEVLEEDPLNRAASAKPEIDFYLKREPVASVIINALQSGEIPERITHNDTKLNNVLIDDATREGICVLDLDTVMPGSALYDFGDSVRIGACTAAEDEPNLDKVGIDLKLFECLTRGYLDAAKDFLTRKEIELLPFSAIVMAFECGMRFLTDYLNGDTYFKTSRPLHNLERCRTQMKITSEMEKSFGKMQAVVCECLRCVEA